MTTRFLNIAVATIVGTAGLFVNDKFWTTATPASFTTQAEAVIGRPLTPFSVAGVARRTTRRAVAAGHYGYGYSYRRYGYGYYRYGYPYRRYAYGYYRYGYPYRRYSSYGYGYPYRRYSSYGYGYPYSGYSGYGYGYPYSGYSGYGYGYPYSGYGASYAYYRPWRWSRWRW